MQLDYTNLINRQRRANVLGFIHATNAEIIARGKFQDEPTPENMTEWVNLKNILEEWKMKL